MNVHQKGSKSKLVLEAAISYQTKKDHVRVTSAIWLRAETSEETESDFPSAMNIHGLNHP
jgi:hypothetical protein